MRKNVFRKDLLTLKFGSWKVPSKRESFNGEFRNIFVFTRIRTADIPRLGILGTDGLANCRAAAFLYDLLVVQSSEA
jgi:hypothetical protein